jgi:hypothetical protein
MNRILPKISFAGAMYSSAEDLFKFDQGFFKKLLSPLTQNYSSNQTQNLGMLLLAYGTPMDMEHLTNLLFIVLAGFRCKLKLDTYPRRPALYYCLK